MSRATNQTWNPPPLDWINWYNKSICDIASKWTGAFYHSVGEKGESGDLMLDSTMKYLQSLMPSNISKPTDGQLLDWTNDVFSRRDTASTVFTSNLVNFPIDNCGLEICQNLEWEGDSDIAGVGMMVSFYIVAILTTIWVVMIAVGERWTRKKDPHRKTKGSNLLLGFQESSIDFLDATLVFAAAMILAAIVRFVGAREENTSETAYSLFGLSTFSVFPALALQSVTDREKTHWVRLFLWLVVIASCIALDVLYREVCGDSGDVCGHSRVIKYEDLKIDNIPELVWQQKCEGKRVRDNLEPLLTFAHVWLALNMIWWLYYVVRILIPSSWERKKPTERWCGIFKWIQKRVVVLNALVCIAIMFGFIGCYHYYTDRLKKRAGESFNKDGKWTFGQVLALATWIPVIVQFLSVTNDPEKAMSARHSFRYKVVPVEDTPQEEKTVSDQSLPIYNSQES